MATANASRSFFTTVRTARDVFGSVSSRWNYILTRPRRDPLSLRLVPNHARILLRAFFEGVRPRTWWRACCLFMPQARHLKSPFPCVHRKEMTFRATLLSVVILNCIGMWIGSEKKERCRLGMLMPECGNAELASHMQEAPGGRWW